MLTPPARCDVHGFLLSPAGACLRCRKDEAQRAALAVRRSLRKLYAASGILFAVLVVFAACRSVATAFADGPRGTTAASPPPPDDGVLVVYTTSTCPACRIAKSWMSNQGIAYVERNIDSDAAARADVARLTGASVAVPTFVVGGEVQRGFSAQALSAALARHGMR